MQDETFTSLDVVGDIVTKEIDSNTVNYGSSSTTLTASYLEHNL